PGCTAVRATGRHPEHRLRSSPESIQGQLPSISQVAHRRLDQPTQAGAHADEMDVAIVYLGYDVA
ncbi:MAG: hypothetical protein ABTQ25_07150, partial [Nitrosomonas ureae]